jgi:hypothetical protein
MQMGGIQQIGPVQPLQTVQMGQLQQQPMMMEPTTGGGPPPQMAGQQQLAGQQHQTMGQYIMGQPTMGYGYGQMSGVGFKTVK